MPKKIISISGNESINFVLETTLSQKYKLIPVVDPAQGMYELKRQNNVALIVVDVDYNTQACWELLYFIQESWLHFRPSIILSSDREIKKNIPPDFEYRFFFKPFNPLRLLNAIDELLSYHAIK